MKKVHKILIGIAALQVVFLLASYMGKRDLGHYSSHEPLLTFSKEDISKIEIKTGEETIQVIKDGANWVLPDYHQFPVEKDKVSNLLEDLSELKKGWPVGKTLVSAKQFKTTDEEFEKQIHLFKENKIAQKIYVGTSPSFKKVHIRVNDEKETYLLHFETYSLNTEEKSWRDDDLLKRERHKITKVTLGSLELLNNNNVWKLADLKETEEMVSDKLNDVLSKITDLRFDDVLGNQDKKEYRQSKPDLEFSITIDDIDVNYRFSAPAKKDYYVLKVSEHPFYFKITKSKVDLLKKIKRKELVKEKPTPTVEEKADTQK